MGTEESLEQEIYTGMIIANAADINKVLLQLQKKIQQLEQRIKTLENK